MSDHSTYLYYYNTTLQSDWKNIKNLEFLLSNGIRLRLVIFSGVMFPMDPAVVIDVGEEVILRYFSNVEKQIPISQLVMRVVQAEDLISGSPTTHLQVYRQRTKYPEDLFHELPISGWRSVLRKLISHLKVRSGSVSGLLMRMIGGGIGFDLFSSSRKLLIIPAGEQRRGERFGVVQGSVSTPGQSEGRAEHPS